MEYRGLGVIPPPFSDAEFEDYAASTAYVDEHARVDKPCQIAEHVSIYYGACLMGHVIVGERSEVGQHVLVGSGVILGQDVRILPNSLLVSGVVMGDAVVCGPSTVFAHPRRVRAQQQSVSKVSPTLVRQGATLAPNTTIASGHTLGQYCFVEAGSVVDCSVPDYAIMSGNPVRLIGWRCQCGEALTFPKKAAGSDDKNEQDCKACGTSYTQLSDTQIVQTGLGFLKADRLKSS